MTQPAVSRSALMVAGIVIGVAMARGWALLPLLGATAFTALLALGALFLLALQRVEP